MTEIVIKNLDDAAIERLRRRAATSGCSLEEEIVFILTKMLDNLEAYDAKMEGIIKGWEKDTEESKERRRRLDEQRKKLLESKKKWLESQNILPVE